MLETVKNNEWALQFASEELRNDKEVVLEAVYNSSYAISFLSLE